MSETQSGAAEESAAGMQWRESSPSIVVHDADSVRRITLQRPEKLNAMDGPMTAAFFAAIDDAMRADAVHVVVISGAGRAFCAGADLKAAAGDPIAAAAARTAATDTIDNRRRVDEWLRLWSAPKPIIAQVHGYCIGIANELVAGCDLVVCGESAKFGMPEVREFALPPTLGFWPMRIGLSRAKELLYTGRWVDGDEAVRIGLANQVVRDEQLYDTVDALAAHIAAVPRETLAVIKQATNSWAETFGIREAALRGAEYHALYHATRSNTSRNAES